MTFFNFRSLLYYFFESRISISNFSSDDLKHFKDCINLELKRRRKKFFK